MILLRKILGLFDAFAGSLLKRCFLLGTVLIRTVSSKRLLSVLLNWFQIPNTVVPHSYATPNYGIFAVSLF